MIKKALLFGAGVATGIYSVPLTLVYVKPIQKALANRMAKIAAYRMEHDPKFRAEALELSDQLNKLLKDYPEDA